MTQKTKLITIAILSIIAFLNAFYLSYDWLFPVKELVETSKVFSINNPGSSFCDINETLSCSSVLDSPLAQIFGIPFPVFAMIVYPLILLLALVWLFWKIKNHFKILSYLAWAWILFNGYFIYQETFNIGAFCPLCMLCSAIIISIFVLSFLENKKARV